MSFLKTTKTFKHSKRWCEICEKKPRTRIVGVFMDDGEWVEEYGVCKSQECFRYLGVQLGCDSAGRGQ